jgi:hypothetical protein
MPGDDDLVLRDVDGRYYWIKKEQYERFPVEKRVPDPDRQRKMLIQLEGLKRQGVMVADIPSSSMPEVGFACYLIDLGAIRRASTKRPPPATPPSNAEDLH